MYTKVIELINFFFRDAMYQDARIRQSELLQLILLDAMYSMPGSEQLFFKGGTAIRWVYGGSRFSEDLDFVTSLQPEKIESLTDRLAGPAEKSCIAQFGPGKAELKLKSSRPDATKLFFIYRPDHQRERIAVKVEFERLAEGVKPETEAHILRELPQVPGLMASGVLIMPYTSSIIVSETPTEILSDKVRALYERPYLKGRDIYDVWFLTTQLGIAVDWPVVRKKLQLYKTPFTPARSVDYFSSQEAARAIQGTMQSDLPRFIPPAIMATYQSAQFKPFIKAVRQLIKELKKQGLPDDFGMK